MYTAGILEKSPAFITISAQPRAICPFGRRWTPAVKGSGKSHGVACYSNLEQEFIIETDDLKTIAVMVVLENCITRNVPFILVYVPNNLPLLIPQDQCHR